MRLFQPVHASLYDICGPLLDTAPHAPGRQLQALARRVLLQPGLRWAVLAGCRHPGIPLRHAATYREMLAAAMAADAHRWRDPAWIERTFAPLAQLLDSLPAPGWQLREPETPKGCTPAAVDRGIRRLLAEVWRIWDRHKADPFFPVHAQPVLSGDDSMTGAAFLDILKGLGAWQQQNATLFFGLLRAFLMACPHKLALVRGPHQGVAQPLLQPLAWITHRTAFYDELFFEHLLAALNLPMVQADPVWRQRLESMLQSLVRFIVVTSREELNIPGTDSRHPAVTCLPMGPDGKPLCRMSDRDWNTKQELGFGDYLPDVDTTMLALAVARQWLDVVADRRLRADPALLEACQDILDHPWPDILARYQHGSATQVYGCTNAVTGPLDYHGGLGLWLERPFADAGRPVVQALGNDMCLGHNLDVLESLLANRRQWNSLEGEHLQTCRRLFGFLDRAFTGGAFGRESALRFYLPATGVHYLGRLWRTHQAMTAQEQALLDPDGRMAGMRRAALDWLGRDFFGATCNAFDAAVGALAASLLRDETGLAGHGGRLLLDAMGQGRPFLYRGYEWTLVRHPTRIIVGSSAATALFALGALAQVREQMSSA